MVGSAVLVGSTLATLQVGGASRVFVDTRTDLDGAMEPGVMEVGAAVRAVTIVSRWSERHSW